MGSEEGKGNTQIKEATELFKKSGLNFIGNVEGNDLVAAKRFAGLERIKDTRIAPLRVGGIAQSGLQWQGRVPPATRRSFLTV